MKPTREPFDALRPVNAPAELRAPALAAAGRALEARHARPDWWTRVFSSRLMRLGWAAAVLALVAAHVALSLPRRPHQRAGAVLPALAAGAEPELIEMVRLPAVDAMPDDVVPYRSESRRKDES